MWITRGKKNPAKKRQGFRSGRHQRIGSDVGSSPDLKKEVAVDNADVASRGYLTNAKAAVLSKAKDSQSQYLLSPYGTELGRSQIAGRRFEVSNNVHSNLTKGSGSNLSAVIYGNFADLLIGLYGTLEILVDPYTDFAKGTTGVRIGDELRPMLDPWLLSKGRGYVRGYSVKSYSVHDVKYIDDCRNRSNWDQLSKDRECALTHGFKFHRPATY